MGPRVREDNGRWMKMGPRVREDNGRWTKMGPRVHEDRGGGRRWVPTSTRTGEVDEDGSPPPRDLCITTETHSDSGVGRLLP